MDRITGKGFVSFFSLLLMATLVSTQTCPNNIAVYNPNIKTACVNGSTLTLLLLSPPSIGQDALTSSNSLLHHTRIHHHCPGRCQALQARPASNIRQNPLSQRIPGRNGSRARDN